MENFSTMQTPIQQTGQKDENDDKNVGANDEDEDMNMNSDDELDISDDL